MPSKRRSRADYDDDENEEEEDDRRPRKRAAKKESSSGLPLLLIAFLGGGGLLGCLVCGGIGVFFLTRSEPRPGNDLFPRDDRQVFDKAPPVDKPVVDLQTVKPAGTKFTIDANCSEVKDIVFAPQGQGVGYLFWDTRNGLKKTFDYWDLKGPKRLARIELPDDGQTLQLSPKGSRLLHQKAFPGRLSVWSLPAGQPLFKDWEPYPKDPKAPFNVNAPQMVWAGYIAEDRLVSVAQSGQFDVWDMTAKNIIATNPAPKTSGFLSVAGFSRAPQNFTLSPDRRLLALANGDGFDIFEALTAKKIGKTESLAAQGRVGNIWAVAFNRDGTQLVARGILQMAGKNQDFLWHWDVPSGAKKTHWPMPTDFTWTGPITWLGPRHIMVFDGNIFNGNLITLADGRSQRICENAIIGEHFARRGPDERIWYTSGPRFAAQAELIAVDLPEAILNQEPAPQGGPNPPPRWYFSPHGITRIRPAN